MVETIPQLLGKNAEEQDDSQTVEKYLKLKYTKNRQLTQKEIIDVNKIFRGYGLRPVPVGTYSHAVAQKLNERLSDAVNDDFDKHAEKEKTRTKSRVQQELKRKTPKLPAHDEDDGGVSESKRTDPEYQDDGRPLPKKKDDEDDEDDVDKSVKKMSKTMERKARFKSMAQRNQRNKTSEQIRNSKEAVKQAAKDYKEQKQEQQKQADELRNKSILNKYTKKAQANFKAKRAKEAPQPPIPDMAPRQYNTRARSNSADSPKSFFQRLQDATPKTHRGLVKDLFKNTDRVLKDNPPVQEALKEAIASKGKRISVPVLSSSGVDTSTLPISVNQHPVIIANYETNINEIKGILTDIGTGQITVQQKNIINKYLPDFIKSTKTKAGRVQEALNAMQEKLTDAKLLQGMTNLKIASPMTANPAFELPKPPKGASAGGGGGARK